ncbi:MAG: hypothetical protein JW706_00005, partial [Opitutales bacterium]|nr:hypothetical protein [Opitutales bacterium]
NRPGVVQYWPAESSGLSWWDPLNGEMAHKCRIDEYYDGAWMVVSVPLFDDELVLGIMPSR